MSDPTTSMSQLLQQSPDAGGLGATTDPSPATPAPVSATEPVTETPAQTAPAVEPESTELSSADPVLEQKPWYEDTEYGIIYNDEEAAKIGILAKEKFIQDQRSEIDRYSGVVFDLQSKLESMTEGKGDFQSRVKDLLPEKFKKVNPDSIEDDTEIREYYKSIAVAEATVETEDAEATRERERQVQRRQDAIVQGQSYVDDKTNEMARGRNSEDKYAFLQMLENRVEVDGITYTPRTVASLAYGINPQFADIFLDGLESRLKGEQTAAQPVIVAPTVEQTPVAEPAKNRLQGPVGREVRMRDLLLQHDKFRKYR